MSAPGRRGPLLALVAVLVASSVGPLAQGRADRSRPPALLPPPDFDLPSIHRRTLQNGLAVWIVESHEVPIVQLSVVIRAGAGSDPAGKYGLASLTAAMLDEGAGERSALQIADDVEFLGAALTTTSSFDGSAVRVNVPAQHLGHAIPILADVVLRPSFPEKEVERLRQERLTTLLQAGDDAASIAAMAFARFVFGPMHRYGSLILGTEASVEALSSDDLRAFHASHYQPANATLLVVGDTTPDAVLPRLEEAFGGWRAPAVEGQPPAVTSAPQLDRRQIYVIDKPDAEQSQVRIGWVGAPRTTPDYFPLLVLNTVLGGSFTSRLNQNLREQHGYTYGASSIFDMRLAAGPFVAAAGVQTDRTADAIREFFNELDGIRRPIGAEELDKAKSYIARGFPGEFETTTDRARRLEELTVYGLPEDYFERYIPNVLAVTAEQVRRAAERHIQPTRFAVVVVGDRRIIEPGIRALNLGPVRAMTVAEALGP